MSEKDEAAQIAEELRKKGLPTDEENKDGGETEDGYKEVTEEVEDVDEIVNEEDEDEGVGSDEGTSDEYTEDENQAISKGWRPKDNWDGDPDDWVPAKQFLKQGELFDKIHNQNRQLKHLNSVVDTLVKQHKDIFSSGYDKAKRELKTALRQANKDDDDSTAELIEEQLEKLELRKATDLKALDAPIQDTQAQIAPEFEDWIKRNNWFVQHGDMRAYAEAIGVTYAQRNPQKSNTDIYQYVTDEVKKRFPERFGMTMKKTPRKSGSPVEGNTNLTGERNTERNQGRVSLTTEEKQVGRIMVQRGLYKNLNEYAVELKKFGVKQ